MQTIKEYKIEYSIDYAQYWPGAGVSNTAYDNVYTGVGSTYREAYEDMLECASCDYDVDSTIPALDDTAEYDVDALEHIGGQIELLQDPDDYEDLPQFYVSCYIIGGEYLRTCDQCNPMTINGVWMHEHHTCPNDKKKWDAIEGEWYTVWTCPECGDELREDEECNCCDPEEEEEE